MYQRVSEMDSKKTKNKNIIKSPKLKGAILENILIILCKKESTIYQLEHEIQKRLPSSYKSFKKHLIYLIGYELISYNGQRKVYLIECNGLDLLYWINK